MEIKICYLQTALEIRTRYNICEATVSKKAKKNEFMNARMREISMNYLVTNNLAHINFDWRDANFVLFFREFVKL